MIRRLLRLLALALLAVLMVMLEAGDPRPPARSAQEQARGEVLESFLFDHPTGERVVAVREMDLSIQDESTADRQSSLQFFADLGVPPEIAGLLFQPLSEQRLPMPLAGVDVVVSRSGLGQDAMDPEALQRRYSPRCVLLAFSPVVFSPDGERAVFLCSRYSPAHGGSTSMIYAKKELAGWKILATAPYLVS
jgi:hypothetical protein